MNTLPVHDPVTSDLRGLNETVAMPGDIDVANLPNSDTPTDDMRGHEPEPESDPQSDNTRMIVGAVAVALIGGIGIVSYATGMWTSAPVAPHVVAYNSVAPAVPAAVQQPAVVPAPPQAEPPVAVEKPPVPAPVVKRAMAPRAAVRARPEPIAAPPETMAPDVVPAPPLTTTPPDSAPISPAQPEPTPPVQSAPDQTAPPAPPPAQQPQ